ncbi:putative twin-arginine translocation pathway signal protein [Burkholderia pseudomallei]|nr:putative twin-arginine translocation pathway signal protein [Burkholderia pseudomallei]
MIRRLALVLAVAATSTAACMSVLAGWQRGGWLAERLVWVATGLVLVTSAHLLPALLRGTPTLVRIVGSVLWATCLATACIGHTVFFVSAQHHAGELRVSALPAVPAPTAARSLTTVMADRATATAQLAAANARYCRGNCPTLEARRATLAAKVDALNAEADDIRRQQIADGRLTIRRDALRADPVTSRLAALLGAPVARIDLLFGSLFAAVLEGVACLLWMVALRSPSLSVVTEPMPPVIATVADTADATAPMTSAVANVTNTTHPPVAPVELCHADGTVSRESSIARRGDTVRSDAQRNVGQSASVASDPINDDLIQLASDLAGGLLRPTVADIRRHLGCSQAKAVILRRALVDRKA